MTDPIREAFEADADANCFSTERWPDSGKYIKGWMQQRWEGFQAAYAHLAAQEPVGYQYRHIQGFSCAWMDCSEGIAAIAAKNPDCEVRALHIITRAAAALSTKDQS